MLLLDEHDKAQVETVRDSINKAIAEAHLPIAVIKRIVNKKPPKKNQAAGSVGRLG